MIPLDEHLKWLRRRTVYRKCECRETAHDLDYRTSLREERAVYRCRNCRRAIIYRSRPKRV